MRPGLKGRSTTGFRPVRLLLPFILCVVLLLAWPALRSRSSASNGTPPLMPQAPIGPLLAEDTRFTSGFGEVRSLRLHAGIDYSTKRERGMPVLAPAGGWISRLAADYSGYGLQLVLTDSLGRRHLFAHLSAFRDDLAARLEQARQDSGRYAHVLDFPPGEFPVHLGEVIALSGDTGNGPPHLHYELRAAHQDICFNPRRHGLRVPDALPPHLEGLALLPLAAGARVGGRLLPWRLAPVLEGENRWRVADTLECEGPLGFALHAWDRLPDNGARPMPWQVVVVEGADTLFRLSLDAFPLAWNDHSGRVYQRWLQQVTGDPWLRLWASEGPLDVWSGPVDGQGWRGRLEPDAQRRLRQIQLLVRDENENLSRVDVVLRHLPQPAASPVFATPDSAEVAELKPSASTKAPVRKATRRKGKSRRKRPAPPPPDPEWSRFTLPDGLHLRLAPLPATAATLVPVLTGDGDTLAVWGHLRAKGWEWVLPRRLGSPVEVRVVNLPEAPALRLHGQWLDPGREQVWRDAGLGPALVIYSDRHTVESPAFMSFRRSSQGRVFTLGPVDLSLEKDLELEISLAAFPEDQRDAVALFQAGAAGGPVALVGGERDGDILRVKVGKPGSYTLHADRSGPGINLRKPVPIKMKRKGRGRRARWRTVRPEHYSQDAVLVWEVGGDPSGIADVELRLGGQRFYPAYEPDTHLARFALNGILPTGRHELELRVRDRLGNQSFDSTTIRVQ